MRQSPSHTHRDIDKKHKKKPIFKHLKTQKKHVKPLKKHLKNI